MAAAEIDLKHRLETENAGAVDIENVEDCDGPVIEMVRAIPLKNAQRGRSENIFK